MVERPPLSRSRLTMTARRPIHSESNLSQSKPLRTGGDVPEATRPLTPAGASLAAGPVAAPVAAPAAHPCPAHATHEPAWLRWALIAITIGFLSLFLFVPLVAVFAEGLRKG